MMKKITSFLTMLVMLFVSVGASAQTVDPADFENKSVSIGTALDAITPNTWYVIFNGTRPNEMGAFVKAGENPGTGGVLYDDNDATAKKKNIADIKEGDPAKNYLHYFVRLIEANGEGEQNVYQIQFATGKFLGDNLNTVANKYDSGKFNLYPISGNTEGLFGFNQYNMGKLVNNNGVNGTLAYWKSGEITSTDYDELKTADTYNSVWSIHPVVLTDIDAKDAAYKDLVAVVTEYEPLINNFTAGTLPGQYDAELLEAFKASINAVKELDQNPDVLDSMTAEDFQAMAQAIRDAYEALLASKVPITLADGYYRIKNGLAFYVKTTDEETLEEVTTYVDKYMRSQKSGETITGRWGTPEDLSTDATALWKVTNAEEGYFDIVNMATDARFNDVTKSAAVGMSLTSENLIAIDPAITIDGNIYVNLRVSTQNGADGLYLHAGGHSSGAGVEGNLVGWYSTVSENTVAATEWQFLPVSEEEALAVIDAYAPIKDRELMLQRYDSLMTVAKEKLDMAIDIQHVKLIKAASQLSSPYTESSEGKIEYLLDGNNTTFWHSQWSDGQGHGITVDNGIHYLQVDLIEPVDHEIYTQFTRRNGATNDHVTQLAIMGTNNADAEKEACEELLVWDTPFASQTESFTSAPFDTKGYRYLRLYANSTTNNRGYWHISELQMGYDAPNDNAQINYMGELGTNLQNVIEAQAGMERDDITIDEYNALKDALDAFLTKFTDPTELRQTLADNKDVASMVVTGTQPGFWASDSDASAYATLYAEAEAYDAKGDYTPEKSADYVERLTAGAKNIFESAIGIQEGKWYRLRFPDEATFEKYAWDKVAGNGTEDGKIEPLFGKYVTVCGYFEDEEGYQQHEAISADEIGVGHQIYFDDEMGITDQEMSEFRFINVADTAYMLQHRVSGLFLKAAGESGAVTLAPHPSLFRVRALGYGTNAISSVSINGENQNHLHAQVNHNVLVTWGPGFVAEAGSRSGFYIEEAENVAADYEGSTFNILMADGSIGSWCFPMEVSVESSNAQIWGVNSVNGTDVTLCKLDKAAAGRPFFLVCGNLEDYDPEVEEKEIVEMKHNYEIGAIEPDNSSQLKGTFKSLKIGSGQIVASGNELVVSKKSDTSIGANSAYIESGEEPFDLEATVNANWDETAEDGLTEVINKVRNSGAVYTLDGRLVSKKANLSDVGRMPKGIYILNGIKIVVK